MVSVGKARICLRIDPSICCGDVVLLELVKCEHKERPYHMSDEQHIRNNDTYAPRIIACGIFRNQKDKGSDSLEKTGGNVRIR